MANVAAKTQTPNFSSPFFNAQMARYLEALNYEMIHYDDELYHYVFEKKSEQLMIDFSFLSINISATVEKLTGSIFSGVAPDSINTLAHLLAAYRIEQYHADLISQIKIIIKN